MSQVIYKRQIKKYQNAPGPLPTVEETDEQKRKRLEEEAKKEAAVKQQASSDSEAPVSDASAKAPVAQAKVSTQTTTTQPTNTSFKKPVGSITINGVTASGDQALSQIRNIFAGAKDLQAQTIINGIISRGGRVDVSGSHITLYDSSGNDITSEYIKPGKTFARTGFGRSIGETFNSGRASNLRSWNLLIHGNIAGDAPEQTPEPELSAAPYRGSGWFTYVKDANGKDVYDVNGIGNKNMFDSIRNVYNIFGEEGYDKKYKTTG